MIRLVNAGKKKIVITDFYNNCFSFVNNKSEIIAELMKYEIEDKFLINGLNALLEIDLTDDIKKINVKTVIFHGENDIITPMYGAEFINKNIKNSKLVKKKCGHSYFLENPEDAIKDFIGFVNER